MDNEIKSLKDLYIRVLPALRTKKRILKKWGINEKENEIFKNLIKTKWSKMSNLTLNVIVNDILNYKNIF